MKFLVVVLAFTIATSLGAPVVGGKIADGNTFNVPSCSGNQQTKVAVSRLLPPHFLMEKNGQLANLVSIQDASILANILGFGNKNSKDDCTVVNNVYDKQSDALP